MHIMILARLSAGVAFAYATTAALAQPAQNPEEAAVFIEVHVEAPDPATAQPRLTKVGEVSGFLIHRSGWLITAAHVTNVEVPAQARLVMLGSVRSRHTTKFPLEMPPRGMVASDVALLRFPPGLGSTFPYLCVIKHPEIQNSKKIVGLGFPLGFDLSVRPGEVTSLSGPNGLIQTNLGLARGMSGGPVLDDKRAVIGVVHGGIEGQSSFDYFTPVNMALPLFDTPPASYVGESCSLCRGILLFIATSRNN
jgi:S1-C subfamily serine protease